MKGTVSYSLVLHYVHQVCPDTSLGMVLISTVLGVVLSNILFFGIVLRKRSAALNRHQRAKTPVLIGALYILYN